MPRGRPRIVLIDRPQSPQSFILAGQLLPVVGTEDLTLLSTANEVLGGDFLARINMDLRETKGWSYGAFGFPALREHQVSYVIQAGVQADRTGDSIRAIQEQVRGFLGSNGTQANELSRVVAGNVGELPGQFETSGAVLGALRTNALYHRPTLLRDARRPLSRDDRQQFDQEMRRYVNPTTSSGWWSATPSGSARSSSASACRSRSCRRGKFPGTGRGPCEAW